MNARRYWLNQILDYIYELNVWGEQTQEYLDDDSNYGLDIELNYMDFKLREIKDAIYQYKESNEEY